MKHVAPDLPKAAPVGKFAHPAPRRQWIAHPDGKWSSIPWTPAARAAYEKAGAWFGNSSQHDFA